MEEEKRKIKKEKLEIPEDTSVSDYEVFAPPIKKNKKTFTVVLVTPSIVIFRVEGGTNSFTSNIWGNKLKEGDEISL